MSFFLGNESASGAARLPRTSRTCPGCGAPDGLFPDPRFIDVVHTERNFTHSSAGLFLPRYSPACLYLQREPGVRWPRSSPAASETSCAVSTCAQGREADRARCLGARGAKPPSQLHTPSSGAGIRGTEGARPRGRWLTEVRAPCPCPALLYGDAEKPAESGGSEPPRATSRKAACACNQKPCSCPKADINYAFLHATGKGDSWGPGEPPPFALPRPPRPRGARTMSGTSRVEVEGGGGPYGHLQRRVRHTRPAPLLRVLTPASARRWAPSFQGDPRGRAL